MSWPWLVAGVAACVLGRAAGGLASWRGTGAAEKHTAAVHGRRETFRGSSSRRDAPGGPREESYFNEGRVPFKYINIEGSDDQWHTYNPAAPEMSIPKEMMQVPNPSDFDMVPRISAPEDRWPQAGQSSPYELMPAGRKSWDLQPPTLTGKLGRIAQSHGGGARFGGSWFVRDYRPVVAPEDRVPQDYYDYFEGFVKDGKVVGSKKESLLRIGGQSDAATAAEEAAARASDAAAALGQRGGSARDMRSASADGDMSAVEAIVQDGDAALGDATGALSDIRRAEVVEEKAVEAPKKRHWKMRGQLLVPALVQGARPPVPRTTSRGGTVAGRG